MIMSSQNQKRNIIYSRITEAKEYCMLTGDELAGQVGVSRQAVFQFEKGIATPKPSVLYNISSATSFPIEFFYTPNFSTRPENSILLFRDTKSNTEKTKKSYGHTVKWVSEIRAFLSKYINWIENTIPTDLSLDFDSGTNHDEIEEIAQKIRTLWGLADYPIDDICGVLENNGIIICQMPFKSPSVEAYSEWVNGVPYIFYGGKRSSAAAFNFSIAHELGHLILHQSAHPQNKKEFDILEAQANYFAGAFLMPLQSFSKIFVSSSIDAFIPLKHKWQVSIGAMIFRAYHLQLISDNQKGYLFKQMGYRGFRTKEPLDDVLKIKKPAVLFKAIELLNEHNILPLNAFVDEFPIGMDKLELICSFPEYFISKIKKPREQPKLRII